MTFDYLMGYIMSISACMQNIITIFHLVQEIGPFSRFQNLEHGKVSTDEKCHFAISWARSCKYQCLRKSLSKYSISLSNRAIFTFSEFEPRQCLGQSQMTFANLLGYILSLSMRLQNCIKIFQTIYELSTFFDIFHEHAGDKILANCPVTKSNV